MGNSSAAPLTLRSRKGSLRVARGYSRCSGTTPTAYVGTRTKRRGSVGWSKGATRSAGTRDAGTPKAGKRNAGAADDGAANDVGPGAGSADGSAAGEACWVLPAPATSMGIARFVAFI